MNWSGAKPEIKNVYSSLYPLYFLCNWSGLACYCDRGSNHRIRYSFTWYSVTKCVLLLIGYFSGVFSTLESNTEDINEGLPLIVLRYYYYASAVLSLIMALVSVLLSWNAIRVIKDIDDVDRKFFRHGLSIDFRGTYTVLVTGICLVVFLLVSTIIFRITMGILHEAISVEFFLKGFKYVPVWIQVVIEMNYFCYMDAIKRRFVSINDALDAVRKEVEPVEFLSRNWRHVHPSKNPAVGRSTQQEEQQRDTELLSLFDVISAAHLKLCDTALLLHRTFIIHLLILITCCFIGSVSALFLLVVDSYKANLETGNVMFTLWTCSNVVELVLIIYVACSTRDQAAVAGRIFHRIRNSVTRIHLQDAIETCSMQMHHGRLEFSVCQLFPFDYTLLHTIIASITTYLIIMVQFRGSVVSIAAVDPTEGNSTTEFS